MQVMLGDVADDAGYAYVVGDADDAGDVSNSFDAGDAGDAADAGDASNAYDACYAGKWRMLAVLLLKKMTIHNVHMLWVAGVAGCL